MYCKIIQIGMQDQKKLKARVNKTERNSKRQRPLNLRLILQLKRKGNRAKTC